MLIRSDTTCLRVVAFSFNCLISLSGKVCSKIFPARDESIPHAYTKDSRQKYQSNFSVFVFFLDNNALSGFEYRLNVIQ